MNIKSFKTFVTLLVLFLGTEAISYQHSIQKLGVKKSCVPKTSTTCLGDNGVGVQVCDSSGRRASTCKIVQCNDGFTLSLFGLCKKVATVSNNSN